MKKTRTYYLLMLTAFFVISCSSDGGGDPQNPPQTENATVKITATNRLAAEPSTNGLFTITLSSTVTSSTKVNYSITGTATNGTDYQTISDNVTIAANTYSKTVPITIKSDSEIEDTETVILTLTNTNNSSVTISSQNSATVSITDDTTIMFSPENANSFMVNPNSTDETIALFYNLKVLSETSFIIGQQDAFNAFYNNNSGDSDIKKTTGNDPGLLGSDFMFITDDNNNGQASNWFYQQEQIITGDAIEAYNKGMVNAFCWHLREPYEGDEFYTDNMTDFQKENAFKSILPGGANHEYYKEKLQKVANVTKGMVGNDGKLVPIIFRPFHEFDGNWFWWGQSWCTSQEYKTLWQFTVEYLRDTLNVTNMLFAFSPDKNFNSETEYLLRYPGDAYVDILGMDNYGDFANQGQAGVDNANNKLQILTNLAKEKVKIAALTETGFRVTSGVSPISGFYATNMYNAITQNDNEIAFMMFWNNNNDGYYTPPPGQTDTNDFIDFTNKPNALLENELPNMYQLPN